MGRLINIIPKTFFSGKKIQNDFVDSSAGRKHINNEVRSSREKRITTTATCDQTKNEQNIFNPTHTCHQTAVSADQLSKEGATSDKMLEDAIKSFDKTILQVSAASENTIKVSSNKNEDLQEEINNLKRSFLYEKNTLIEKCELEKFELRENYEEEKSRLKRAFENERLELIKEIERKDKMLHELARVLKEEYGSNLDNYKKDLLTGLEHKAQTIVQLQTKMNSIIENLAKIVENNECHFKNLEEFQKLKSDQEEYTSLSKTLKSTATAASQLMFDKTDTITKSQWMNTNSQVVRLTRTHSNPETNTSFTTTETPPQVSVKTKSRSFLDDSDVVDMQFEMAEVYRKQKADLVKLFNSEKEEERARLQNEKKNFEKDVRIEYESRMSVERKGWQETIEDLEREIKILRYEREQMDHNYCIGMDEMRTEFEKEKQMIYRRYSDQQALIETKLKELNKSDTE